MAAVSKTIINILTSPISLINQQVGDIISGAVITAIGIASGNPALIAFGLSRISGALATHPKPAQTETALKSPTPERVSGYGRGRHFMAYALYVTNKDGIAVDVGAFHDGKINAITGHYLADIKITLLSGGRVQAGEAGQFGELSDIVTVFTRLGEDTETAFSEVIAKVPDQWTSEHRGDGVVTGCVITKPTKAKNFQMIFPSGGPNNMPLSLVMERQLCFDWRDPSQDVADRSTWKYTENAILHLAHYQLVRDNKDWATHFVPTLAYWTAAADVCDEGVPLKGVQTIMAEKADDGSSHITVTTTNGLTAGMTIAISATGDTSLTETRTVTTITTDTLGFVLGLDSPLSNDHPSGSQVVWSSSEGSPATEPRYRSCLAHKHTDEHKSVVGGLLACCDGWMAPRADGALVVYAGHYYTPTVTIGPDLIVGYSLQDGVDEESAVNSLSVTYVSANHDFNVVDTDPWTDEDDITARGKVLSDQIPNQVPTHSQARRLAKAKMARINAAKRGTITTTSAGKVMLGQRYVRLVIEEAGTTFLDAAVEVVAPVKRNPITGGITFNWVLADPNMYTWNPATEEGDPAPVGNRIAPAPLDAPEITSAVSDFSSISDDGTGVRVTIIATAPDRDDLTWYARWRVVGDSSWNEAQYSDIDPGTSVTLQTGFVPTHRTIEVEVAYQVGDGRVSPYSSPATDVDSSTDATAPDAASAITLVSWSDAINLTTARISRASSYRWRFYDPGDLTTPIRTIVTSTPSVAYTSLQATSDGIRRDYVATVAGVNGAGAGTEASTTTLTLAAPSAITSFAAANGASESEVTFDLSTDPGVVGYVVATSTVSGFDPMTQGTVFTFRGTPAFLQNLSAGTFYAIGAAYDAWTNRPDLLNFSSQDSFTISTGGGGVGGGGGDGGGGYCVAIETPILLANAEHDGPGADIRAEMLTTGHWVWTRPELDDGALGEWGAYQVSAITFVDEPVLALDIGTGRLRATAAHRMWIGGGWVRMDALGSPDGSAMVAKITVATAHTYVSGGIISHNLKQDSM
jgi:hypothetical protein